MIPKDTIPIVARRYTSVHGGRREEARSQRYGVQIRLRWGRGTTEKCDFEANSFLQGVSFFVDQAWMSSRKIRLVLCCGHIQRVYAATSFLQPLLDPNPRVARR